MARFHINSNGDVKPCKATKISCQFGDDSLHFDNEVDARKTAEKALEKAGPNALRGKKSSLKELMIPGNDSITKLIKKAEAAQRPPVAKTPKQRITEQTVARERANGYERITLAQLPRDVERYLARNLESNRGVLAAFARDDERYKVLVEGNDGRFFTYSTPNIKDVPHVTKAFAGWSMSLHPRGPKISFRCARCNRVNEERLGDFDSFRQGDCRTRCRCGQLNSLPITQG